MRRYMLPAITFGLLVLVIADRISAVVRQRTPRGLGAHPTATGTTPRDAGASGQNARAGTPGEGRLARLAARQQLTREAGATYLDSLILSTDSVVRRWPDRYGTPIRVAIV